MIPTLVVLSFLAPIAVPQSLKLNRPLVTTTYPTSGPFAPTASPGGKVLVYGADREEDGSVELYSVSVEEGATPRQISARALPFDGSYEYPSAFRITADGRDVVFKTKVDAVGNELAVVPIDGSSAPRTLDGTALSGRLILEFLPSSDGLHAVYLTGTAAGYDIFSARLDGSTPPVKLNGQPVTGAGVVPPRRPFSVSSDGGSVLYVAQNASGHFELFVVPTDGGAPARTLTSALVDGGDVRGFAFAQGSSVAVYAADQEVDQRFELFAVATDGTSPPRKLNGELVPGGDVGFPPGYGYDDDGGFEISPDGTWAIYRADEAQDERFAIHGVPVDGSRAAVQLSSPSHLDAFLFSVSSDSRWVVYRASGGVSSVPIDGSAPARPLGGPLVAGGEVYWAWITLDGARVVYLADQDTEDVFELYDTAIEGGTPAVKLNAPIPSGGRILIEYSTFAVENGIVYTVLRRAGDFEIDFALAAGGAPPRLLAEGSAFVSLPPASTAGQVVFVRNAAMTSITLLPDSKPVVHDRFAGVAVAGGLQQFEMDAVGERVVYRATEEGDGDAPQLDSVRTHERLERVELSLPDARELSLVRVVPDGSRVVFTATLSSTGAVGLYSAPTEVVLPPVRLDPAIGDVQVFGLSPDGSVIVFRSGSSTAGQLFSARVDGSASAVPLSAPDAVLGPAKISADGTRVAYLAWPGLYTVPIDGAAPAELVSGDLQGIDLDFQLAGADGHAVAFRAGLGRLELYVAPSEGSGLPRKLNARVGLLGEVVSFALAPDGSRAAYLADPEQDKFELFGVPLDGSTPAVRLHPALAAGRDVLDFRIAPDGNRVVYRADALADEVVELFTVPIDASRPPVRLDRIQVAAGDVLDFRISADSRRVVYRADELVDQRYELFSTAIGGSRAGPLRLSRPLVPGGSVRSFELSADGRSAVFTADRDTSGARTLLAAPVSGLEKATELAGPFQGGGSVGTYRVGADGRVVVYTADQDEPGIVELYAARR